MPPGKKNKRGDRGSTEASYENSAAKRNNMADNGAVETKNHDTSSSEQNEPDLHEIKAMLVDIQTSPSSILRENKQFNKQLDELKTSLQLSNIELHNTKTKLDKAAKANIKLEKRLHAMTTSLDSARNDLREHTEEINYLNKSLDNLEQYTRRNSLEFHGVPENSYESTKQAILKIAAALEVQVSPSDIEISHKLRRKNNNSVIIAKFCSHKVKTSLYKARIKLKNTKAADLYPGFASAVRSKDWLFINKNLTNNRRHLLDSANQRRRDGCITSVWTMDGKVYVKTFPDGNPTRIFSENDLDAL